MASAHGADRLTDDGGSSEASLEQQQTPSKRKKPKPPKAKKPTPASAAAALKLDAVEKVDSRDAHGSCFLTRLAACIEQCMVHASHF